MLQRWVVHYVLIDIDNKQALDKDGKPSQDPCKYYSLNQAWEAKKTIGNSYIDKRKEVETANE